MERLREREKERIDDIEHLDPLIPEASEVHP